MKSLDVGTQDYIRRHWEFLAAMAWKGYEPNGERGVIVINMSLKLDSDSEHRRAFYMTNRTSETLKPETDEWVEQFVLQNQAKLDPPEDHPKVGKPRQHFAGWYDYVYSYDPTREVVFIGLRGGADEPGIGTVAYTPAPEEVSELLSKRKAGNVQ